MCGCRAATDAAVLQQHSRHRAIEVARAPAQHRRSLVEHCRRIADLRLPRRVGGQVEAAPGTVAEVDECVVTTSSYCQVLSFEAAIPWPRMVAAGDEDVAPVPFVVRGVTPRRRTLA